MLTRQQQGAGVRFVLACLVGGGLAVCLAAGWDLLAGARLLLDFIRPVSPGGRIDYPATFYARAFMAGAAGVACGALCLRRLRVAHNQGLDASSLRRDYAEGLWLLVLVALGFGFLQYLRERVGGLEPWQAVFMEDGLLEWAQVGLFAVAMALCAAAARRHLARGGPWWAAAWLGLLAAGLCFVTMEEISWGQRILGWETGPSMQALNYQGEANVHNLLSRGGLNMAYTVLAGLLSGGLLGQAVLAPMLERSKNLRLLLPPGAWLFLAVFFPVVAPLDELMENVLAVLALAYAVRVFRAARAGS